MDFSNKRQKLTHEYQNNISTSINISTEKIINIQTKNINTKFSIEDNDFYISPDENEIEKINLKICSCHLGVYLYGVICRNIEYDVKQLKKKNSKFCVLNISGTKFEENTIYDINVVNDKDKFNSMKVICIIVSDNDMSDETLLNVRRYHRYFNC